VGTALHQPITNRKEFIMSTNITNLIASINHLVSGIKENQPKAVFVLSGTKYTAPELVTLLQEIVTLLEAVPPARGAYLEAAKAADTLVAQNRGVLRNLKQFLQIQAGDKASVLAAYGLTPAKPLGQRSPAAKVAAADSAKATRVARHTMGKKQKKAITGATAPATPAPASSPTEIAGNPALQTAVVPAIPGH
jgi:hypothetical protein